MFASYEKTHIENIKTQLKKLIVERELLAPAIAFDSKFLGLSDVVIAGGFFTSVFQHNSFKDVDIFILNNNVNLFEKMTKYYPGHPHSAHDWQVSPVLTYDHIPTVRRVVTNTRTKGQYILTTNKTREELLSTFDFVHTKVSYVPEDDKMYMSREVFDCILRKELKPNLDKGIQAWREQKYLKKGWVMHVDQSKIMQSGADTKDALLKSYRAMVDAAAAKMLENDAL